MVSVLCPNSSLMVVRSTPDMTRWLAKVFLRSWNVKSLILALLRAELKDLGIFVNAFSVSALKNT